MSGFVLSPGITPELVIAAVLEFPLLVGVLFVVDRRRGVPWAFALNAAVLGLVKLATDHAELGDVAFAAAGILGGGLLLAPPGFLRDRRWALAGAGIGALVLVAGVVKIVRDIYDPFDVLLAAVEVVVGALLAGAALGARAPGSRPVAF